MVTRTGMAMACRANWGPIGIPNMSYARKSTYKSIMRQFKWGEICISDAAPLRTKSAVRGWNWHGGEIDQKNVKSAEWGWNFVDARSQAKNKGTRHTRLLRS